MLASRFSIHLRPKFVRQHAEAAAELVVEGDHAGGALAEAVPDAGLFVFVGEVEAEGDRAASSALDWCVSSRFFDFGSPSLGRAR